MLIQFSVSNFRSIRSLQTLSLVKGKADELKEANTFSTNALATGDLLRSAAIYGPNAAGKTNFIEALRTMRKIVVSSASDRQRGDAIEVTPFRLDSESENAPTEFEIVFVVQGVRYQYGFSATSERVHQEWLFAYPKGAAQQWVDRTWNPQTKAYDWGKMASLTGLKRVWRESTRSNALFVSTAVQLNCEQLQPIYDWFEFHLQIAGVAGWNNEFAASLCKDSVKREMVLDLLRAADLDIADVRVEVEKFSEKHLPADMPEDVKATVLDHTKDGDVYDIKTVHLSAQGKRVEFDFDDESTGTRKFFAFAGPWLNALQNGYVLAIDELSDNLHPSLVQFLVALFHDRKTNPKNAQLVFTVHETAILNQQVFRRDQIWFCEKESDQATRLYPLTDFSPRKGRENLEMAYLSGRYGALPYLRSTRLNEAS